VVTASAVDAMQQLTHHLAQLFGELGVRALLVRSTALASTHHRWLANTIALDVTTDVAWATLRTAMARQPPREIRAGFVALLAGLIALLERLIGERLVQHLLHDVWPEVFQQPVEEAT
jgi:hypothetical protein